MNPLIRNFGIASSLTMGMVSSPETINKYVNMMISEQKQENKFLISKPTKEEFEYFQKAVNLSSSPEKSGKITPNVIFVNNNALKENNKDALIKEGSHYNHNENSIVINLSSISNPSNEENLLNKAFDNIKDGLNMTKWHEQGHMWDNTLNRHRISQISLYNYPDEIKNTLNNDNTLGMAIHKELGQTKKDLSIQEGIIASNLDTLNKESFADGFATLQYLKAKDGPPMEVRYKELQKYADIRNHTWKECGITLDNSNHWTTYTIDQIIKDHKLGKTPTSDEGINAYLNQIRDKQTMYYLSTHANEGPEQTKEVKNILSIQYDKSNIMLNEQQGNDEFNNFIKPFVNTKNRTQAVNEREIEAIVERKIDKLTETFDKFNSSGTHSHNQENKLSETSLPKPL